MKFANEEHERRFLKLMISDNTHHGDTERLALWYIVSGNLDLYAKRHHLYDFDSHGIKVRSLDNGAVDLCSSSRALVRLGFNLYNRYFDSDSGTREDIAPCDLFCNLDSGNLELALNAIRLRFDWNTALEFSNDYKHSEQQQDR